MFKKEIKKGECHKKLDNTHKKRKKQDRENGRTWKNIQI